MTSVDMLTTAHHPHDTRIYHKESVTLADAGYDVSILAHHTRAESADGVEIVPIGTADSRVERWAHLYRMYRTAVDRGSDVYHFHDPELLPVGVLLSQTTDASVVYDVHEDYENAVRHRNWIPNVITPTLSRSIPRVQSACARHFDAIITATEWIAEQFEATGHPNVQTVRNFPLTKDLMIGDLPDRPGWEHTLVYVGSITESRGIFRMLRLVERLQQRGRDVGLWLLGPFETSELERRARKFARAKDLKEAVRMFGRVDHMTVYSYLAASDIGLFLPDVDQCRYGIPTKNFEYMYAELPVFTTDALGPRKYLPSDAGVLVRESNTERQADLVEELLDDPERREKMGRAGRKRVKEEFNWERESEKLLSIYTEMTDD